MMAEKCVSTGKEITNDSGSVKFKCPNCLKGDIVRSLSARKLATKYVCSQCGFEGPN